MGRLNLYFIRHAETYYNACAKVQGSGVDCELNERGQLQAKLLYEYYKHVDFAAIYTSALKRTQQTVSNFVQAKKLRPIITSDLNEISWGVLEGLPTTVEVKEQILFANSQWRAGNTSYGVPLGESPEQVWQRAKRVLAHIKDNFSKGNVLICTHGRTLRVMLSMILGYGLQNMHLFSHYNTGVNLLQNEKNLFWVLKLNDISHLGKEHEPLG